MKPYEELDKGSQLRRFRAPAMSLLEAYPLDIERVTPLVHLENTTFRVDAAEGRFVLQIKRPFRSRRQVLSEMTWLDDLANAGFDGLPVPLRNNSGDLVSVFSGRGIPAERFAVLYRWVAGRFYFRGARSVHFRRLGELAAGLHRFSSTYSSPSGFERRDLGWSRPGVAGELSRRLDVLLESTDLEERDRQTFAEAGTVIRERTIALSDRSDHGLIHADLHLHNVLFIDGRARAIDFDDCGFGDFAQDLGTTLWYLRNSSRFDEFYEALLEGYRSGREASDRFRQLVILYRHARTIDMANWFVTRRDNPEIRERGEAVIPRYAKELRTFLSDG